MKYLILSLFCVTACAAPKATKKPKAIPMFANVCEIKAKGNVGILKLQKQAKCPVK